MLRRVGRSQRLTHELHTLLPSPLASYCQVADLNGKTLTIVASSPVWAAKLRYLIPTLLKAFGSLPSLSQVAEINIKISKLPQQQDTPPKGRQVQMSHESAEQIRHIAEGIEDPGLRESLLRLSRHGGKKSSK